jgi:hypothetical protein
MTNLGDASSGDDAPNPNERAAPSADIEALRKQFEHENLDDVPDD